MSGGGSSDEAMLAGVEDWEDLSKLEISEEQKWCMHLLFDYYCGDLLVQNLWNVQSFRNFIMESGLFAMAGMQLSEIEILWRKMCRVGTREHANTIDINELMLGMETIAPKVEISGPIEAEKLHWFDRVWLASLQPLHESLQREGKYEKVLKRNLPGLEDPESVKLLKYYQAPIERMFVSYCSLNKASFGTTLDWNEILRMNTTLDMVELMEFCRDFKIIPGKISRQDLGKAFRAANLGDASDEFEQDLNKEEWNEMILRMALFMFGRPEDDEKFPTSASKLQAFLDFLDRTYEQRYGITMEHEIRRRQSNQVREMKAEVDDPTKDIDAYLIKMVGRDLYSRLLADGALQRAFHTYSAQDETYNIEVMAEKNMVNFVVDLGIVEGRLEADLQDVREVVSKTMKRFSRSKYGTKVGLSFKNFLGAMIDILQLNSEKDHVQRPWSMEDFLSRTSEIYFRGELESMYRTRHKNVTPETDVQLPQFGVDALWSGRSEQELDVFNGASYTGNIRNTPGYIFRTFVSGSHLAQQKHQSEIPYSIELHDEMDEEALLYAFQVTHSFSEFCFRLLDIGFDLRAKNPLPQRTIVCSWRCWRLYFQGIRIGCMFDLPGQFSTLSWQPLMGEYSSDMFSLTLYDGLFSNRMFFYCFDAFQGSKSWEEFRESLQIHGLELELHLHGWLDVT